ncbi:MAG: hypothetical protein ACR2M6_02775 [Vampirovibrionia bacterium]
MSKDNWKGTSGWGTIDDPTGVLSGRVLVATGGDDSTEDYVLTEIGTSNDFDLVHYSAFMNYAWNQAAGTHPMNGGNFSVVARATTYTGDPALAYNCYLGQIDVANNLVKIIRRFNNIEYILNQVALPDSARSRGVLHSLELRCYDTDPVTLQVYIDDVEVLSVGDTDAKMKLTTGDAGIQSQSGTVYVDNFSIYEYTSDGTAPLLWTPTQLTNVVVWLKADAGITLSGSDVTGWADQSGNSNDASASSSYPQLVTSATNGLDVVSFDGAGSQISISDAASIDLNSSSGTIFIVQYSDTTPSTSTSNRAVSKGLSYGLGIGSDATNTDQVFATINGGSQDSDPDAITNSVYQILGVVYDSSTSGDATRYGFWVDGTNKGIPVLSMGADNSTDMFIGSNNSTGYFDGNIAEILVFNEELTISQRQLIEGYLAHKWATWPRLPTDHPYYRLAPTT